MIEGTVRPQLAKLIVTILFIKILVSTLRLHFSIIFIYKTLQLTFKNDNKLISFQVILP